MQNDPIRATGEAMPRTNVVDLSTERAARADRVREPSTYSGPPAHEELELHVRHLWRCARELRQAIEAGDQIMIDDMLDEIDMLQEVGPTADFRARCAATLKWASA
jgi:hypothetical protein